MHLFKTDDYVYNQLADLLRSQITQGDMRGKIPGIRELADQYSVNFKTANKAVSLLVDEGLLFRLQGKGTFVADVAAAAATAATKEKTALVGFLLTDIVNPYFAHLAQAIQKFASSQNLTVLVGTNHSSDEQLSKILDGYRQSQVQLVIAHGGVTRKPSALRLLEEAGFPLIGIHTHLHTIDDIWPDVRAGAQMATEHLLARCGESIGLVSGSDDPVRETGRFAGYRDAILRHGGHIDARFIAETQPTYRGGHQAVADMIERHNLPKALLFYNQIMAMGGVSALISHGYKVPDDIAIASIDDSIDVEQMLVPTTTVSLPFDETARHALHLCQKRLTNVEAAPECIRVAPRLIVRESSGG